ncbi:hypothetical protein Ga0100231_024645 [Opitutaceae bacterium TAV4]|nr:hypothetical protein Ga0100231_024645 [Opitutaceae bacterium TAV4]RRK00967.1 hypothetical protein Ga0100230_024715 [Opitutaceae bacterium TAV3]
MKHTQTSRIGPKAGLYSLFTTAILCVFVLAALVTTAPTVFAAENLIPNGDFSTATKDPAWPDHWGKIKTGKCTWETDADGKKFMRLESTAPGQTVLQYRVILIPADAKAVELSCRARVTGLKRVPGQWFDARIMANFLSDFPTGAKVKGAKPVAFNKDTDGWVEKKVMFNVPEGAKAIELMPTLFQVEAGQFDLSEVALRVIPVTP